MLVIKQIKLPRVGLSRHSRFEFATSKIFSEIPGESGLIGAKFFTFVSYIAADYFRLDLENYNQVSIEIAVVFSTMSSDVLNKKTDQKCI